MRNRENCKIYLSKNLCLDVALFGNLGFVEMVDDVNGSDSDSSDSEEMEDYGPLHEAAGTGRMDTCKYLVEELGFDINADANNDSGMPLLPQC